MSHRNIFILLGQSNMVGQGALSGVNYINNDQIFSFDKNWSIAKEPLHKESVSSGVGLAMSFADTLIQNGVFLNVDLIPLAVASTGLDEWMPYSHLYNKIFSTIEKADANLDSIKGILWHHGESESKNFLRASSYADRFNFLIKYLRKDLNNDDLPIIAGKLGEFLDSRFKFSDIVNEQLYKLERSLHSFKVVDSYGLTSNKDNIHIDSNSLIEFGKRYARKFMDIK